MLARAYSWFTSALLCDPHSVSKQGRAPSCLHKPHHLMVTSDNQWSDVLDAFMICCSHTPSAVCTLPTLFVVLHVLTRSGGGCCVISCRMLPYYMSIFGHWGGSWIDYCGWWRKRKVFGIGTGRERMAVVLVLCNQQLPHPLQSSNLIR